MTPFLRFLERLRQSGGRVIPTGNPDARAWFERERRKAAERRELHELYQRLRRHDEDGG
jgi:hypothetical protein